jgi:subtilase family serine protease
VVAGPDQQHNLLGICNNIAVVQSPATPTSAPTITLTPAPTVAQASSTPAKPDLTVIDISGPVSIILDQNSTKTATYRVTVQNIGAVAAGQFSVGLVLPDGSLTDLGAVPALQPGQAAIFTATVNFTTPGSARLTAIADKDNVVDESN